MTQAEVKAELGSLRAQITAPQRQRGRVSLAIRIVCLTLPVAGLAIARAAGTWTPIAIESSISALALACVGAVLD
jgi:hypothetical protein